jgi:hypothetical protein
MTPHPKRVTAGLRIALITDPDLENARDRAPPGAKVTGVMLCVAVMPGGLVRAPQDGERIEVGSDSQAKTGLQPVDRGSRERFRKSL